MTRPDLLEALLYEPGRGYFLFKEHIERLCSSAATLGYPLPLRAIEQALAQHAQPLNEPSKVRLVVRPQGDFHLQSHPAPPSTALRCALSPLSVPSDYLYLRHKTSERSVYQQARHRNPHVQDVILYNERGEVTETSSGNVVLELDGEKLTPDLASGLLPGTYRRHLLETKQIATARLTCADVERASSLWMINSVRRRCPLYLAGEHQSD